MYKVPIQSSYPVQGREVVLYVEDLELVDLLRIDEVRAVVYRQKGSDSHIEVVCTIKGIPLVQDDLLHFVQGSEVAREALEAISGPTIRFSTTSDQLFQVAIFDHNDLTLVDHTKIDSIFLRTEHLLYKAAATDPEILANRSRLAAFLRLEISRILDKAPPHAPLIVRGPDVRSDDRILGPFFFAAVERNPELGVHGTRYLLRNPHWVDVVFDSIRGYPDRIVFACPFVTRVDEFFEFREKHCSHTESAIIPFAETPAVLFEISRYRTDRVCIGLKDLTQFYFAADRSNSNVARVVDYVDSGLVGAVSQAIASADSVSTLVSVYQSPSSLDVYSEALAGVRWIPSMAASYLRMQTNSVSVS